MNSYKAFSFFKVVAATLFVVLTLLFLKESSFSFSSSVAFQLVGMSSKRSSWMGGNVNSQMSKSAKKHAIYGHDTGKKKRLPDVLIIGTAKCGTSTLYHYLSIHPDAVKAKREVEFFNSWQLICCVSCK